MQTIERLEECVLTLQGQPVRLVYAPVWWPRHRMIAQTTSHTHSLIPILPSVHLYSYLLLMESPPFFVSIQIAFLCASVSFLFAYACMYGKGRSVRLEAASQTSIEKYRQTGLSNAE